MPLESSSLYACLLIYAQTHTHTHKRIHTQMNTQMGGNNKSSVGSSSNNNMPSLGGMNLASGIGSINLPSMGGRPIGSAMKLPSMGGNSMTPIMPMMHMPAEATAEENTPGKRDPKIERWWNGKIVKYYQDKGYGFINPTGNNPDEQKNIFFLGADYSGG